MRKVKCVLTQLALFPASLESPQTSFLKPEQKKLLHAYQRLIAEAAPTTMPQADLAEYAASQLNILLRHRDVVGLVLESKCLHVYTTFLVSGEDGLVYGPFRITLITGHCFGLAIRKWCPQCWLKELGILCPRWSRVHPFVGPSGDICAQVNFMRELYELLQSLRWAEAILALVVFLQFYKHGDAFNVPKECVMLCQGESLLSAHEWERQRAELLRKLTEDDL